MQCCTGITLFYLYCACHTYSTVVVLRYTGAAQGLYCDVSVAQAVDLVSPSGLRTYMPLMESCRLVGLTLTHWRARRPGRGLGCRPMKVAASARSVRSCFGFAALRPLRGTSTAALHTRSSSKVCCNSVSWRCIRGRETGPRFVSCSLQLWRFQCRKADSTGLRSISMKYSSQCFGAC